MVIQMKKFSLLSVVLLAGASALYGADFANFPQETKLQAFTKSGGDAQIKLFHVTYDRFEVTSPWNQGGVKLSGVKDISLKARKVAGFDGQNAYSPLADEDLKYHAPGNINAHTGTLIMWVSPLNYSTSDKTLAGAPRSAVSLADLKFCNTRDIISIRLFEKDGKLTLRWSNQYYKESSEAVCSADFALAKGKWAQLAITWDRKGIALWVNGKELAKAALPEKSALTKGVWLSEAHSYIGIRSKCAKDDRKAETAVDDLLILNRPWTADEAAKYFAKFSK